MLAAAVSACHGRPASKSATKPDTHNNSAPASLAGRYVRETPAWADLTISPAPAGRWRIAAAGTSDQVGPSGLPNDCETVAVGPFADGRIVAGLVPFEDDNRSVDADDLKENPGQMMLAVSGDRITVERSDGDGFCGVGADLTGRYMRSNKTVEQFYREQEAKRSAAPALSEGERHALGEARRRDVEAAWPARPRPEALARAAGESDKAFAARVLHLSPDNEFNETAAAWNGVPTLFVDYETGRDEDSPERPLVALQKQPSGAYRLLRVTIGETEGGRPDVAAIAFANADGDQAKELIVILTWLVRHLDVEGTDYEVRIFDDPQAGQTSLKMLKLSSHFGSDCDCSWSDGSSKHYRFKTVAAVKAELRKLGYN